MVPTSTAEVKLQYEKIIIVFCFCQREHMYNLFITSNAQFWNYESWQQQIGFLLKFGADFNSRSKTAIRKKKEICFVFAKENI